MTYAYPIILTPSEDGYLVSVPDLQINTEGNTIAECIAMARDAIGLWGICEEDLGHPIPKPSEKIPPHEENEVAAFVDIDFAAYRRAQETRTIRKNVTLPSWLNTQAEQAGINFSQVLQDGLKEKLNVQNR